MNLDVIKDVGKLEVLQKGELICTEGQEGKCLFILLKGVAEVILDSFSDSVQSVQKLQAGSVFGEMSLLEEKPRLASVIVRSEEAIVARIEKEDFWEIIRKQPEIVHMLLCNLNNRLNHMLDLLEPYDKRYVYQYRKQEIYQTIQKMDQETLNQICEKDERYVWSLLKFASSSLDKLNQLYVQREG